MKWLRGFEIYNTKKPKPITNTKYNILINNMVQIIFKIINETLEISKYFLRVSTINLDAKVFIMIGVENCFRNQIRMM